MRYVIHTLPINVGSAHTHKYEEYYMQNNTHINICECFNSERFQLYQPSMELNHISIPQSVVVIVVCIINEPIDIYTD